MDFLDNVIAEDLSGPSDYGPQFLGIGNEKQKISAQDGHESDLLARFPFTMDCNEMKKLVDTMRAESAATLEERNSSKQGKHRNDLTGKLRAYDAYIPAADDFMKNTSCAAPQKTETDPLKTAVIDNQQSGTAATPGTGTAAPVLTTGASTISTSKVIKYAGIGLGAVVVIGVVIYLVRKKG